jgi:hypothetical protein
MKKPEECYRCGFRLEDCECPKREPLPVRNESAGYAKAQLHLKECLADAKTNRLETDPQESSEKWKAFIEGIECAIHRLEMEA